jgi:hypothetical protein
VDETVGALWDFLAKRKLNSTTADNVVGILPGWKATCPSNVEDQADNICFCFTSNTYHSFIYP